MADDKLREPLLYILTATQVAQSSIELLEPSPIVALLIDAILHNSKYLNEAAEEFMQWREQYRFDYGDKELEFLRRASKAHSMSCIHFGSIRGAAETIARETLRSNNTLIDIALLLEDAHNLAGNPLGAGWLNAREMVEMAKKLSQDLFADEKRQTPTAEDQKLEDLFRDWTPPENS